MEEGRHVTVGSVALWTREIDDDSLGLVVLGGDAEN
jgi:hypothetical protein